MLRFCWQADTKTEVQPQDVARLRTLSVLRRDNLRLACQPELTLSLASVSEGWKVNRVWGPPPPLRGFGGTAFG